VEQAIAAAQAAAEKNAQDTAASNLGWSRRELNRSLVVQIDQRPLFQDHRGLVIFRFGSNKVWTDLANCHAKIRTVNTTRENRQNLVAVMVS